MNSKKIAIIGAGISGLYLAWKLSKKGYSLTVFEKRPEIGKRTCSGLYSERILKFIPPAKKLIQNKIDFCLIHFPKRTIKVNFKKKFFVIERYKLDKLLAEISQKAGGKIILNSSLSISDINRLERKFERIIGCDGWNSQVRKYLKLPEPHFYLALQGFIEKEDLSNFVEVWPQKQGGFLWKIPRGKEIEYGIIGDIGVTRMDFKKFLEEKKLSLERISSEILPQGLSITSHQKIALCGNAIGLTKPWSGGGVIWSLRGADIILEYFPDLITASKKIKNFFWPEIILSKILIKTVYFLGFNFPWLLPKEVKIDGDFFFHKR